MNISDEVRATHGTDGAIVLDIQQGLVFRLNPVGSRILELLKQGHSEEEIATEVSQQFDVSRDVVTADLTEFLANLEKHHLIVSDRRENPSPDERAAR